MQFSFIIPMLNEEGNIGRCLDSFVALNVPSSEYEVIIVDNGSTDNCCIIVKSYEDVLYITLLVFPGVKISALRNRGAIQAKGEILGFIDADCTVPPDWTETVSLYIEKPEIGVVGCTCKVPEKASWIAKTWDMNNEKRRRLGEVEFVPTGGLAVSKENFLLINGFDETLATNEDCEFCFRMRKEGKKIWSVPDAAVTHWGVPENLWEFYKRQRWHGKHVFKVFLQDVRALNNFKVVLYALYYLTLICYCIVSIFYYVVTGSALLFILALMGLLVPPVFLTFSSLRQRKFSVNVAMKLWLLYLVYGFARSTSICGIRNRGD